MTKPRHARLAVLLAVGLAGWACGPTERGAVPATAPPALAATSPSAAPLSLDALKNAEYPSQLAAGKRARLTDGRYEEAIQPGAATRLVIALHPVYAQGELNGDGADDAAVVLVASGGGSGAFYSVVAVLNEGGAPRPVAADALGDRVKVDSIAIRSGAIVIQMVTHGPQDPLCCPTQQATRTFRLQGERLVLVP